MRGAALLPHFQKALKEKGLLTCIVKSLTTAGSLFLVALLLALTPLVVKGWKVVLILSYILGGIMIAKAIGHMSASLWFGAFAPDVYSSPLPLVAAVALLAALRATQRR